MNTRSEKVMFNSYLLSIIFNEQLQYTICFFFSFLFHIWVEAKKRIKTIKNEKKSKFERRGMFEFFSDESDWQIEIVKDIEKCLLCELTTKNRFFLYEIEGKWNKRLGDLWKPSWRKICIYSVYIFTNTLVFH